MKRKLAGATLVAASFMTVFGPASAAHADPVENVLDIVLIDQCPDPTDPVLAVYVYRSQALLVCA